LIDKKTESEEAAAVVAGRKRLAADSGHLVLAGMVWSVNNLVNP
jgi:hypothetical protein